MDRPSSKISQHSCTTQHTNPKGHQHLISDHHDNLRTCILIITFTYTYNAMSTANTKLISITKGCLQMWAYVTTYICGCNHPLHLVWVESESFDRVLPISRNCSNAACISSSISSSGSQTLSTPSLKSIKGQLIYKQIRHEICMIVWH